MSDFTEQRYPTILDNSMLNRCYQTWVRITGARESNVLFTAQHLQLLFTPLDKMNPTRIQHLQKKDYGHLVDYHLIKNG